MDPVTGKKTEIKKETNVNRRDGASSGKEVSGNTRITTNKTTTNLLSQNRQQITSEQIRAAAAASTVTA